MTTDQGAQMAVQPSTTATAVIVPPGYVARWKPGSDRPVFIPEDDVAEWEAQNGVTAERYDMDEAVAGWRAAYAALPDTVTQCIEELAVLGYIRADQDAAMRANWGVLADAMTFLFKCVAALHPTENQVADAASVAAANGGSLKSMPKHYQKQYGHLIDRIKPERVQWHVERSAADDVAAGRA